MASIWSVVLVTLAYMDGWTVVRSYYRKVVQSYDDQNQIFSHRWVTTFSYPWCFARVPLSTGTTRWRNDQMSFKHEYKRNYIEEISGNWKQKTWILQFRRNHGKSESIKRCNQMPQTLQFMYYTEVYLTKTQWNRVNLPAPNKVHSGINMDVAKPKSGAPELLISFAFVENMGLQRPMKQINFSRLNYS